MVAGSCSGFLGGVVALSGPPMMVFVAVMGLHHSEVRATLVAVDSVAMSVQVSVPPVWCARALVGLESLTAHIACVWRNRRRNWSTMASLCHKTG